jgi:hypothetical protein
MAIKMTQQEVAEWVVDILVNELELKPEDPVPDQELKERYRARNGDSADIKFGLKYAEAQEWLRYQRSDDTWYLTGLGYEYAT